MATENPDPTTGTIDLIDRAFTACPQPVYARMLERFPVGRTIFSGHAVLCRYEDVLFALRHPEIFSSEMGEQMQLGTERPMIPQQIDPPAQTRYRKILDSRFSRQRMAALEPAVRHHANALIDAFIETGECEADAAFAVPLPCTAFLHLMGLPIEHLELFLELKDGIIRPKAPPGDLQLAAAMRTATGKRIYDYFDRLIEERRAQPRDDMVGYLSAVELDGRRLSREEILDICFLLLLGGLDTVTATLGCNLAYLAGNPAQRRRLVAEPALLPGAVEELLRWETPVMIVPRLVKQTVRIGDQEIAAGSMVNLLVGAANVDDREFAAALEVDFRRERNRHLAFGGGPHRCLGSHLARMELRVALEEWHRRIPDYEMQAGETPIYSPGIREVRYLPLRWNRR